MSPYFPRLTMPSHGGLMNPRWVYDREPRILDTFRFEQEKARREAAQKKGNGK